LIADLRKKVAAKLGVEAEVVSCFEAGRDGFWLHRLLLEHGVINHVVEPTSILVNRRARRAKTDRLDAQGLLRILAAHAKGDHDVCSVVRVPTIEEEDAKRQHREREHLVQERVRIENRIAALFVSDFLCVLHDQDDLEKPKFARYIGIDYSGAETPTSSLKGLRVYLAEGDTPPAEVPPPPSSKKYWTRRGIAEWLVERIAEQAPTLVGIDHGFSFPLRYFEVHGLKPDWAAFLDDFQRHWPTDEDIYVDFVRDGVRGDGAARTGNSRWRRLTEERAGSAKSVFHFDVQGSVAKSTHAGIPWLRYIRERRKHVHFWPFDGWDIPAGRSAIVEVYPHRYGLLR
jgi:hypothetical protein